MRWGGTHGIAMRRAALACAVALGTQTAPHAHADGEDRPGAAPKTTVAPRGASPGDERGPGGFVARDRTFYAAAGGRLWYYLNLYYWVTPGTDVRDLWIRAEVTAVFRDLKKWPAASPVAPTEPKVTIEYWEVGASRRTTRIDNHKDFWNLSDDWCAGAVVVDVSLQLGRADVACGERGWKKPGVGYVLESRSYERGAGVGKGGVRFEPRASEPVNHWRYTIPWSACPGRFVRSNWEDLRVPSIDLVSSRRALEPPVVTEVR